MRRGTVSAPAGEADGGCLAGQTQRMATATAMAPSTILTVEKPDMVRQLHAQPAFADRSLQQQVGDLVDRRGGAAVPLMRGVGGADLV